jgi:SAM-dependent methyltransferase
MAHRVCPWWVGYFLASPLRRWLQDPGAIVGPFVAEGMIVLEPGPGMGFFTLELARRVGAKGRVLAVDVQPKMLDGLKKRAAKAGLAERIDARVCKEDGLGVEDYNARVDFALAVAMVHEVPNPAALFKDIYDALKPGGKLLFAEPSVHVRAKAFEASLEQATKEGLLVDSRPAIRRCDSAVLVRGRNDLT